MATGPGHGPIIPTVSALPSASANAGRVLAQGGALWWSDGSAWAKLNNEAPGGGSTPDFILHAFGVI